MHLRLLGTLAAGAFLSAATSAAAQDRAMDRSDLELVFGAYVDTVVEMRNLYAACALHQPAGWDEGAAVLVASLRGAGVAEPTLAGMTAKLALPASAAGIDCNGPEASMRAGLLDGQDWESFHGGVLLRSGVAVVKPGAGGSRFEAARAAVQAAMPLQARMLACLSIFDPLGFVMSFQDWDELIGGLDDIFANNGHAPQQYVPILQAAVSSRLFVPPADRPAATSGCAADRSCADRAYGLEWYTLTGEVERALKGETP